MSILNAADYSLYIIEWPCNREQRNKKYYPHAFEFSDRRGRTHHNHAQQRFSIIIQSCEYRRPTLGNQQDTIAKMGHSSTITTTTSLEYNTVNNNNEPVTSKRQLCDNIVKNGSSANIDSMNNNVNFNNNVIKSAQDSIGNSDTHPNGVDNTTEPEVAKEYSYFGYKVEAKLKFLNIIGIFSIHFLFLYTLTQSPLGPSLWTYAWGKFCHVTW